MSFTVYKSSAGSGKTFTLVKEYIRLSLAKPDQFRHILAITFTNKAANEMKERVIKYLTELSADPPDEKSTAFKFLLPDLIKETSFSREKICANARLVLDAILHNYSDFAIGTIDSFVHRIIRSFAHDLNIPMNFEVEMDTDRLLSEAIDLLLNKAGSDELLTKILVEFTESKIDDEKSWHIEYDLQKFAKQLFLEDNLIYIDKLKNLSIQDFLEIRKKLNNLIAQFEIKVTAIAGKASKLISDNNIPLESFFRGSMGIGVYFRNLSKGEIAKIKPNSYVAATVEEDKWYAGKATTTDKTGIDKIKGQLGDAYLEIDKLREKYYKHYLLQTMICANIYPIAVLNEIEKIIDEIKKDDNILPISEFNKRISGIVISQPMPFIYERLGEKYQNYLIDEFQDTSTLQWMNLLPLIENSLANGNFNMIVGDGKQAIYRWRGGDVEQFALLPELPKTISDHFSLERIESIKRNHEGKNLQSNFRSKTEIVDFNNRFFSFITGDKESYVNSIYSNCTQTADAKNAGGYIQIDFSGDAGATEETYDESTFRKTEEIIEELQEQKYLLKDVAILCRSNNNASLLARHLISKGVNVVSEESLLITGSGDVNFLLAWASFLSNNNNDIAKYRILHFLISKKLVTETNIHTATGSIKNDTNNSISTELFIKYIEKNNYPLDISTFATLPVYELFEKVIDLFRMDKSTDVYIRFFLDAVFEFSSGKKNNIAEFLEWWEEQKGKRSIITPAGMDAVTIMTIHKAKGLEFPIVIYPFAGERIKNTKDNLWINIDIPDIPQLQSALINNKEKIELTDYAEIYASEKSKSKLDLLNVLYVAMTRPSDRLYIITRKAANLDEPKAIPDFLASFIRSIGVWDDNQSVYSFGEKSIKASSAGRNDDSAQVSPYKYPLKSRSQVIHLREKASALWDADSPQRNSEWGNLIHYAFAQIKYIENIDEVISSIIQSGMITKEKGSDLAIKIKEILANPLIISYFQPGYEIRTEADMLLKDGSVLRPDRVLIKGNDAVVIDYKSGKIKESHKEQLSLYAKHLEEMGLRVVEQLLIYVDLASIVKVA